MRRQKRPALVILAVIMAFFVAGLFLPGLIHTGELEPNTAPGPTMKTLDKNLPTWSRILPSSERFELVMDGEAVLDRETVLVWARNANLGGFMDWQNAISYCNNLAIAGRKGWRLPSVAELSSLVDTTQESPSLPDGHYFKNVQSFYYWLSNTYEGDSDSAWRANMFNGSVSFDLKVGSSCVWPVRGGK